LIKSWDLIKVTLGTTWGQMPLWVQTGYKKHRIYKTAEERGYVTWKHQNEPSQQACATWHTSIGPPQHVWAPYQWSQLGSGPHQYVTWQLVIRPPQQTLPHDSTLSSTHHQANFHTIKFIWHMSLRDWWHITLIDYVEVISLNPISLIGGP
jgi:hypothetical protein